MCGGGSIKDFAKARLPGSNGLKSWVAPGLSADVDQAKKDLEETGIKKPHVDAVDPAAQRAAADAEATAKANARIAFMRKAQRENSLMTGGGATAAGSGRSTLGV
jgi:hypothetical protein